MANNLITTELYPIVVKAFSDQKNIREYNTIITKYIDKNSELLAAIGPMDIILFTDDDKNSVFNLINITPSAVKSIKDKSTDRKTKDNLIEAPFSTLMATIIRYFDMKKDKKLVNLSIFYLTMSMYPFIYRRSFKYKPTESIMNYTINNLSEKYKIKQAGNLMNALIETSRGAYDLHRKNIIAGIDRGYTDFIYALKTRTSSLMKNIAKEFYDNYKTGKYLNTEVEYNEEDKFREADSSSYLITRTSDNITLKLIIDGPPMKLVTMSAQQNKVSINELRNYVTTMINNEHKEEIHEVVEAILTLYLFNDKNDITEINSNKFLLYCLDIYKRANTTDEQIIKIKKILDGWLEDLGTYKKTQRVATINNFRKALFTFFVLSIMYYNT